MFVRGTQMRREVGGSRIEQSLGQPSKEIWGGEALEGFILGQNGLTFIPPVHSATAVEASLHGVTGWRRLLTTGGLRSFLKQAWVAHDWLSHKLIKNEHPRKVYIKFDEPTLTSSELKKKKTMRIGNTIWKWTIGENLLYQILKYIIKVQ